MKYLQNYKIFESRLTDVLSFDDIKEELDDLFITTSTELPNNQKLKFWLDGNSDSVFSELDVDSKNYEDDIYVINIDPQKLIGNKIIDNNFSRLCKYLSSRYGKEIGYGTVGEGYHCKYIIGYHDVVDMLVWIDRNEFRNEEYNFEYLMDELDENNILCQKYINLIKFGGVDFKSIINNNGFTLILETPGNDYNVTVLAFEFYRDNEIKNPDVIEYKVYIRTKKGYKDQRAKNEESFNVSFNVQDTNYVEKLGKIIIGKANKYLKIKKVEIIYEIIDKLSEQNDFFDAIDIEIYDNIEFLVDKDDDFVRFRIEITDNLEIFVRQLYPHQISSREEDKTSVAELIHDVYLKLTQKKSKFI